MQSAKLRSHWASRLRIASGLQNYWESRSQGAAIIRYHGVIDRFQDAELESFCIDRATLTSHLRFLHRKFKVVPLATIIEALRDRVPIPNRWVAIQFDDALHSQVTLGAEILAEHDTPWSLAVPAGLIGSIGSIWSYEVAFMILRCWQGSTVPDPVDLSARLPMNSERDRSAAMARLRAEAFQPTAGSLGVRYRDALVAEFGPQRFYEKLEQHGGFKLASWDQLRQVQAQGVELLAHGWQHLPHDTGISKSDLVQEVQEPRKCMQQVLGNAPRGFVYPCQCRVPDSWPEIEAAGYEYCLLTNPGRVSNSSAVFELPRYDGEHSLTILRRHLLTNFTPRGLAQN